MGRTFPVETRCDGYVAGDAGNGWKSGHDPVQRPLRIIATVMCLGGVLYLAVFGLDRGVNVVPVLGLLLAAALLLLGYDGIVLPGISRRKDDE